MIKTLLVTFTSDYSLQELQELQNLGIQGCELQVAELHKPGQFQASVRIPHEITEKDKGRLCKTFEGEAEKKGFDDFEVLKVEIM